MKLRLFALAFASLIPLLAHAEIEKVSAPCQTGVCVHQWPKLPEVRGWHQDPDSSIQFDLNAQTPDTAIFSDSETIIYAKASYRPNTPAIKNLTEYIENDQLDFLQVDPEMKIEEIAPLVTADGQKLRSYIFSPSVDGNWELLSYGEEGDFYLVFTLSSRTKAGLTKARADYEKFITHYKAKP